MLWLYRGAWLDWDVHDIDMAVPMSPAQVLRKRKAIFFHQTQLEHLLHQLLSQLEERQLLCLLMIES